VTMGRCASKEPPQIVPDLAGVQWLVKRQYPASVGHITIRKW